MSYIFICVDTYKTYKHVEVRGQLGGTGSSHHVGLRDWTQAISAGGKSPTCLLVCNVLIPVYIYICVCAL